MSRKTKGWLITIAVLLLLFAPATFMMLIDRGIDSFFVIFNQGVENLNNLPTMQPTP